RPHQRITIVDSDNLLSPDYLNRLNDVFVGSVLAVQGARYAKNLNTDYANLDGISDLYYRYTDRKLLWEAGSSSTLSGSGMAFESDLYEDFVKRFYIDGAGFDKLLQYYIVSKGLRIAFSNSVIVYDQKTTSSNQLVKQRSRWINTWFKSVKWGGKLFLSSIGSFDRNKFLFSITLLSPPLFLKLVISGLLIVLNSLYFPHLNILMLASMTIFLYVFYISLKKFSATRSMYRSLYNIPKFMLFQVVALFKADKANKISVATEHDQVGIAVDGNIRKKRVLHAIRQGEVGGGESHVLDLVKNFDNEKYEPSVLAFTSGAMIEELKSMNFETYVIETKSPFDISVWNRVSRLIKEKD